MLIVGIGGTLRSNSSCESALQFSLNRAQDEGCEVAMFAGEALSLPFYNPSDKTREGVASQMVEALREASGVLIASPSYHGSISGLVKNALDYVEDLAGDERAYLDGLPVGCIGLGYGHQGAANCVRALRDVAHSLRGFPTPYAAAINSLGLSFDGGEPSDAIAKESLERVGSQVAHFAARVTARPEQKG